jgi:hypothetical protein
MASTLVSHSRNIHIPNQSILQLPRALQDMVLSRPIQGIMAGRGMAGRQGR